MDGFGCGGRGLRGPEERDPVGDDVKGVNRFTGVVDVLTGTDAAFDSDLVTFVGALGHVLGKFRETRDRYICGCFVMTTPPVGAGVAMSGMSGCVGFVVDLDGFGGRGGGFGSAEELDSVGDDVEGVDGFAVVVRVLA